MRPLPSILRAVGAALVTTYFIACNAILGNESEYRLEIPVACTLNSDCASGSVCIFQTCSPPCRKDVDCPNGARCLETQTNAGTACVSSSQAKCSGNECPKGTICSDGTCRTGCTDTSECRSDQTCSGSACVGTDPAHDPPTSDGGGRGGATGTGGAGGTRPTRDAGMGTGARGGSGGTSGITDASTGGTEQGGTSSSGGTDGGDGGGDPCIGVLCEKQLPAECHDSSTKRTYASVGTCSGGTCTYTFQDMACPFGCTTGACNPDPCVGKACASPPANKCQDGTHLTAYDTPGTCSAGTCTYSSHVVACTCVNGACTTDPCASVVCNTQQPSTCLDANTRETFAATGTCSLGSCSYAPTTTPCTFGCAGGVCKADPCLTTTCTPPAAACFDALTLRTYTSVCGTGGTCINTPHDTPCAFGCASGACQADPCAGKTCTTPPATTCLNTTTLRTFASTGTCSSGTCLYNSNDTGCTNQTCVGSACVGVCSPGQKRCNGNNPESCSASGAWTSAGTCTNQTCVAGACQGVCAPGQATCVSNGVATCNASGAFGTPAACTNQTCIGSACQGSCAPGQTTCSGNGVQTCGSTGSYGAAVPCTNSACVGGACVGVCTPDATPTQCAAPDTCSRTPQYCSTSGVWTNATACVPGNLCSVGTCVTSPQKSTGAAVSTATSEAAGYFVAIKVTIGCQTKLKSFGVPARADPTPANARFALYRDNGNTPVGGALVAASGPFALPTVAGPAEIGPSPANPTITAGDYWLVSNFDATALTLWTPGTGSAVFVAFPFLTAFPSTFPAGVSNLTNTYGYYLNIVDSPP